MGQTPKDLINPVTNEPYNMKASREDTKPEPEKITGYRELTPNEIELINTIKEMAKDVGEMIAAGEFDSQFNQRWLAIAKTDLQTGFMALTRSIAKPTSF